MKNANYFFSRIVCLFAFFVNLTLFSQTQQVNHDVPFSSGMQNMWGPSWNAFSINQNINLFNVSWNESFNTGNGGIVTILGQQFGGAIQGAFSGAIGSNFSLTGFTTGEVQVDYPIQVDLTMTNDLTYDQGDVVSIQTAYEVEPGYALDTYYPSVGEMKLDVYFQLAGNLSATLCAFGCATFPVIPNFNTGTVTINIMTINASGVDLFSVPALPAPLNTPLFSYGFLPLTTDMIPNDPLGEYGLSGSLTMPYVITEDELNNHDLSACGDSAYVNLNLNIFDLIGGLNIPYVSAVAANLAGEEELMGGLASVYWNFFDASFDMNIHNKQCFDFKPKVYGKFEFPVAVDYTIRNVSNAIVSQGTSSIINVQIGNRVDYKFPCYYEELSITPTYSIDGQFTNRTYDSISFDFLMSAFAFGFSIPAIEITPAIHVPRICIPIPYPCPTWTKPWRWCTKQVCTPAFTIPAIGFDGFSFDIGPLWETAIPLGNIQYNWYHNTWALEGFDEYSFSPFKMIASRLGLTLSQVDVSCHEGTNGAIDITTHAITPATPYSYVWTNGATTQDITNLTAGSYQVEVYDANNCNLFIGAVITEPEQPIGITHSKQDKLCNAGVDNGSIDVLVQGGTAPYSYAWNNGATVEDIFGLATGTYSLIVTDSMGCTESTSVVISEPLPLGQVAASTNVNCKNDATGSIQANAFGGTMPYNWNWNSGHTTDFANNLTAGVYTLTITDGNGCLSVASYNISEPVQALSLNATVTNVLCKGNSTGAIDITTNGGTSGYSYTWINGQGIVLPFQSEDVNGIVAGTYTVMVTDNNGCSEQLTQIITEPANTLLSTPVVQNVNCFGEATGEINPVITGGSPSYTYNWSNGTNSSVLTGAIAGSYILNLVDANGCTETFNYNIAQPQSALSIALSKTDVLCYGENTGAVNSAVNGGSQPYTYNWNNGASSSNINNLSAQTYTLNVIDAKGCIQTNNIAVNQPLAPLSASSIITDVDCYGSNSGAVNLTVVGGTTPYNYQWSNSGTVILTQTTPLITGLIKDTYHVSITDANGCQLPHSSVVNQPLAPIAIAATIDDVNCYGMSDGAVDIAVTGGTLPYSYSWSNGATTEDIASIIADNYVVTITDGNLCTHSQTYIVPQPSQALVATLEPVKVKCHGGLDGEISSTVTGGTLPYSYSWSNGSTLSNLIGIPAGIYNLTVTDGKGCTSFTGTIVEEPTQALVVNTTIGDVQCHGANDGTIEITITGGVAPYSYNWGNQNEILLNNFSELISNLNVGEYFIRVKDRNGCINEQYVQVNQPQPIQVQYIKSDALCFGDSTGSIDLTISGGVPNYSVTWDNGQTTEDAFNIASGNHNVLVVDAQLCEYRQTIFVGQPDQLNVAHQINELSCIDESDASIFIAPYGGVSPYFYSWSNGATDQNNENLIAGTYDLILTDGNGCIANYTYVILESENNCVFIPNTITPNGDNYNDTWIIDNIELYPKAEVRVFNKWGNLIYESVGNYTPWEGTHNGNPLPSEVYYYIIVLGNDKSDEYTGTITIIR